MLLQRCIVILSVLICYAYAQESVKDGTHSRYQRNVNDHFCMRYPFHKTCRGSQTRKRYANVGDDFDMPCCSPKSESFGRHRRVLPKSVGYDPSSAKSKFWAALLDNAISMDALYDAYTSSNSERREMGSEDNEIGDDRRTPMRDILFELDTVNGDY